ncbi:MAG: hypothetical protein ABI461_08115 [Polyangiaceae bacterium]
MTFRFRSASILSLTTLTLLVACGGQIVSIGGESTSQSLTPSTVTVATESCPTGYQHANICCTGGDKSSEATCESWPNDPFHPCDTGYTTYPNAASCCSLENPADCLTCTATDATLPSAGNGDTPVDNGTANGTASANACAPSTDNPPPLIDGGPYGGGSSCASRCPPGYTGISPYDSAGCCQYANGVGTCFGESAANSTGPDDAGMPPILLPDGGEYDAGTDDAGPPVIDGGSPDGGFKDAGTDASVDPGGGTSGGSGSGGVSTCSFACPDGWFVADPTLGVCCNNTKDGAEECFAAVFPDDNGGSGGVDPTGDGPPSSGSGGGSPEPTDASLPSH